ncbi:hypothetical protein DFJ73DRAFT_319574 [Zopfochytrium polystomum]|nr:hypothetical protein DFJ73DRAFT_319574 [Zopfochytrium polystomum]
MSSHQQLQELQQPTIIPASRRPDGSLRKEIRVRPGYTPPEEMQRYTNPIGRALQQAQTRSGGAGTIPGMPTKKVAPRKAGGGGGGGGDRSGSGGSSKKSKMPKPGEDGTSGAAVDEKAKSTAATGSQPQPSAKPSPAPSAPATSTAETAKSTPATAEETGEAGPVDLSKKLKAAQKKLRQIDDIATRDPATLQPEQIEKLSRRDAVVENIQKLEKAIALLSVSN